MRLSVRGKVPDNASLRVNEAADRIVHMKRQSHVERSVAAAYVCVYAGA
jgi:hypothetical protein